MGEKVEDEKKTTEGGGEKKEGEGGEKKEIATIDAVLKLDLHCEGCAKKVRRAVSHFEGVVKVKADWSANKLTVTGNFDPALLREKVATRTKKKVDLISPQPQKNAGAGGEKKAEEKPEKKPEEKKAEAPKPEEKKAEAPKPEEKKAEAPKPKEPVVTTVLMKIRLHCDGCAHKIKRTIMKNVDGVDSVSTNLEKDLVSVTGTMNAKELAAFLQEKLKRSVEIVPPPPPPKKDGGGGDVKEEKKEEKKDGGGGGGDKKEEKKEEKKEGDAKETKEEKKEAAAATSAAAAVVDGSEGPKSEVHKMEYSGYGPSTYYAMPPMNNPSYSNYGYVNHYTQGPPPPPPTYLSLNNDHIYSNQDYGVPAYYNHGYAYHGYPNQSYPPGGNPNMGFYGAQPHPSDRMFSDENPNGCSIM